MSTATPTVQVPYLVNTRSFEVQGTELSAVLNKMYIEVAQAVNKRTIGIYNTIQTVTGNQYFSNTNTNPQNPIQFRQSYRQVYTLAALPNSTTAIIPTNITITANTHFVNIYGVAESSGISTPLTPWIMSTPDDAPYLRVNRSTGNIEIITTTANWTSYSAVIVLEYLLN